MNLLLRALPLVLVAGPTAAHEGDHSAFAAFFALGHLLSQPDHLAILALAVAIAAWPLARLVRRRVRK